MHLCMHENIFSGDVEKDVYCRTKRSKAQIEESIKV